MGNSIAKRGKSSPTVRHISTPKMGSQASSAGTERGDCNSSNGSDSAEFGRMASGRGKAFVEPNSISHPFRVFPFPTNPLNSKYRIGKEIRRGRTGVVKVCIDRTTGEKLACKSLDKESLNSRLSAGRVRREAEIMSRLSGHPNVIDLKGVCEDGLGVHFIMELADGGDLSDTIISRDRPFPEPLAARMFQQIALGVQFIHSQGVVHRDLKPENILVLRSVARKTNTPPQDSPLVLKLADFGMAVKLTKGKRLKGIRGTKVFLAPEMLDKAGDYSFEVDIWSLGVILYVLLFKEIPFNGTSDEELFEKIRAGNPNFESHRFGGISDAAKQLIEKMLTVNPKSRWTIRQILESPWLKKHCTV